MPNPELNPMTNPTLGRHLGRWAEVYFTTPAEQREQAVLELLRALEHEESEHPELAIASEDRGPSLSEAETSDHIAALEAAVREFEVPSTIVPEREVSTDVCPVCQHLNLPDQWYCGMCGYRLKGPIDNQTTTPPRTATRIPERPEPTFEREIEMPMALPSFSVEPLREPETQTVRDIDRSPVWPLHVEDESSGSRSKWMALVALLAIGAGVYLYQRRPSTPTPSPTTTASPAPAAASPALTQEPPPSETTQQSPAQPSPAQQPPAQQSPRLDELPPQPSPQTAASEPAKDVVTSAPRVRAVAPVPTPAPQNAGLKAGAWVDSGNEELAKAQELLTGSAANPAQASVWLWKAVSKNNVPAVLMLADLYARGDGVPRSCDQARILLTAALKRGASEAGQKLRDLQSSGCSGR